MGENTKRKMTNWFLNLFYWRCKRCGSHDSYNQVSGNCWKCMCGITKGVMEK